MKNIADQNNRTQFDNLLDILEYRAEHKADKLIYRFLQDKSTEEPETITYGELARKARKVAFSLKENGLKQGDRVLINHLPGVNYIASFFGVLYAGGVSVPIYPPRFNSRMDRINMIIRNSEAKLALTSNLVTKSMTITNDDQELKRLNWIETDEETHPKDHSSNLASFLSDSDIPSFKKSDIAFLQYTSGSTSDPKGVMLTHGSLLSNLEGIHQKFDIQPEKDHGVIWLPPYHDMGFIGGILTPLYSDFSVTLMSPFTFLQRPIRWLEAISKYRGSISGGPNFAYDQCVRRIRDEKLEGLDLSSWRVAFCGAEPIHLDMLNRFSRKFVQVGFEKQMFYPCYGLAESTLIVSGGKVKEEPIIFHADRKQLEDRHFAESAPEAADPAKGNGSRVRPIVSCGSQVEGHDIKIVDRKTKEICSEGQVGEIWVSGPSVAKGYWQLPEETEKTFCARYAGQIDNKNYLRTGDLGFFKGDQLYITGRTKEVLIIRGKNFYPQDIEVSVEGSHQFIKIGAGAAFSVNIDDEERLVIVSEVERSVEKEQCDSIIEAIETRIFEDHGLNVHVVNLVKPSSIPFTSSGKVMRQASRKLFLEGGFESLRVKGMENSKN